MMKTVVLVLALLCAPSWAQTTGAATTVAAASTTAAAAASTTAVPAASTTAAAGTTAAPAASTTAAAGTTAAAAASTTAAAVASTTAAAVASTTAAAASTTGSVVAATTAVVGGSTAAVVGTTAAAAAASTVAATSGAAASTSGAAASTSGAAATTVAAGSTSGPAAATTGLPPPPPPPPNPNFIPNIFPPITNTQFSPNFAFVGDLRQAVYSFILPSFNAYSGVVNCTAGTTNINATAIPVTISATGVYQISIASDSNWEGNVRAYIVANPTAAATFPGYNLTNTCGLNYVQTRYLTNQLGESVPEINDFIYLATGSYFIVIATSTVGSAGAYAVNGFFNQALGSTYIPPVQIPTTQYVPTTATVVTTQSLTTAGQTTGVATTAPATTAPATTAVGTTAVGTTAVAVPTTAAFVTTQTVPTTSPAVPSAVNASNATFFWFPPYDDGEGCYTLGSSGDTSDWAPFSGVTFSVPSTIAFSANGTVFVDVIVAFDAQANFTSGNGVFDPWYTHAILYEGLVGQFDVSVYGTGPCNAAYKYVAATESDVDEFAVVFYNVAINISSPYTLLVSGSDYLQNGAFGVFIRPTVEVGLTSTPVFTKPSGPYTTGCTPSGYTSTWTAFNFTAQGSTYLIQTGDVSDNENYAYAYVYNGLNVGSATAAPLACPNGNSSIVAQGDIYDQENSLVFSTVYGQTYTVVIADSYYDENGAGTGPFAYYAFTGQNVSGTGQVSPNPGSSTGASSGASSGASTSTSTSTSGNANAATSVVFNVFLLFAATIIAAMMA